MGIGRVVRRASVVLLGAAAWVAVSSNAELVRSEEMQQLDAQILRDDIRYVDKLVANKEFDKALQKVDSMQKKQPNNASVRVLKGAVYNARNDAVNARKAYEEAMALAPNSTLAAIGLARLDLNENKPERARQRFEAMLAVDPTNADVMLALAGVASATHNDAEYLSWLEKAAAAAPWMARPHVLLARYHLQKRDIEKAMRAARAASAASANDPLVLEVLGSVQVAAGEFDSAVATYNTLVRVVPNDASAHLKLASAYVATRKTTPARAELARVLALDPRSLEARTMLGSIELNAGKHEEALRIAREMQSLNPKSPAGLTLEGDVLMAQKKFVPAQTAYEKAFAIGKSRLIAVRLYKALSAAGKIPEAEAWLATWLKNEPSDTVARMYLADAYVRAGRNPQAIEQFQVLLQHDPNDATALNNLASLYYEAKDSRALATAEKAYQLKPSSPAIMDTLGWILVEQGMTERGLPLLQRATEMDPASPMIHYHWAVALTKSGDKDRARRQLENLLAKQQPFPAREEAEKLLKQL